ncbi:MAG: hypothetical protein BGN88_00570 [Clostridiales bacterium 43-6]|nr:MAG: hypothetical protein BGN88_00570 [Clostridiales bacterium 43-6]
MNIELVEPQRLRISLQSTDLKSLDLTFDEFDYENPRIKRVLWSLLSDASKQTGFTVGKGKLLIEVFPAFTGGCIIYFTQLEIEKTKTRVKTKKTVPCIYRFDDCDSMLSAVCRLKTDTDIIDKSSLYLLDGHYMLVIYPKAGFIGSLGAVLNEYGCKVTVHESFLSEHATLLQETKAIENIGCYF